MDPMFSLLLITDDEITQKIHPQHSVAHTYCSVLDAVAFYCQKYKIAPEQCALLWRRKSSARIEDHCDAVAVRTHAASLGIPFLVHTHIHLAQFLDADGLHFSLQDPQINSHTADGASDRDCTCLCIDHIFQSVQDKLNTLNKAKRWKYLGLSAHVDDFMPCRGQNRHESASHAHIMQTYATLSPVFLPTSKPKDVRPQLGLDGFMQIAQKIHAQTPHRLVALGGITPERAALLWQDTQKYGAASVAVLGGIWGASQPKDAVEAFLRVVPR